MKRYLRPGPRAARSHEARLGPFLEGQTARTETSYLWQRRSLVTRVRSSHFACATSIRSNGSRWISGGARCKAYSKLMAKQRIRSRGSVGQIGWLRELPIACFIATSQMVTALT